MNYFSLLSKITKQNVLFPFYHTVSNDAPPHIKHLYRVKSTKEFEQDLKLYKKHFTSLRINDLDVTKKYPSPHIVISFDDGLREFKTNAFPLLKKYGFTPILFVNTGFVDNKDLFFRFKVSLLIEEVLTNKHFHFKELELLTKQKNLNQQKFIDYLKSLTYNDNVLLDSLGNLLQIDFQDYLNTQKPYLSLDELIDLKEAGVLIGAHSIDHPLFCQLNEIQQFIQIKESVNWVNKNFNQQLSVFSFPFSDFGVSKNLFDKIYNNATFRLDYSFGTAGIKKEKNKQHLQRIAMEQGKSAKKVLLYQYLYFLLKAPLLKNTIRR